MSRREVAVQELVSSAALFKQLDLATRTRIAAETSKLRVRRGQAVFHRGSMPAGFFIVIYGEIALLAPGTRGTRLTGTVGAGRSFGEPMMFLGKPYIVDARALSDTLLLLVPKEAVFAEIERNPSFAHRMIAGLAARIEALVREIDRQARTSARERLIDHLVRTAGVRKGNATIELPTTKVALASQLGLTAEHLSRLLHDLARRRLLRMSGRRIEIEDVAALAAAASARHTRSDRRNSANN